METTLIVDGNVGNAGVPPMDPAEFADSTYGQQQQTGNINEVKEETGNPLDKDLSEAEQRSLQDFQAEITNILLSDAVQVALKPLTLTNEQKVEIEQKLDHVRHDESIRSKIIKRHPEYESAMLEVLLGGLKPIVILWSCDSRDKKTNALAIGSAVGRLQNLCKLRGMDASLRAIAKALKIYSHVWISKCVKIANAYGEHTHEFPDIDLNRLAYFAHLGSAAVDFVNEHHDEIKNGTPAELKALVASTKTKDTKLGRKPNHNVKSIDVGDCRLKIHKIKGTITGEGFFYNLDQFENWLVSQTPSVNSVNTDASDA